MDLLFGFSGRIGRAQWWLVQLVAIPVIILVGVGTMVAFAPPDIIARRLEDVVGKTKTVPPDSDLLATAKALGVTFGD